MRGHAAVDRELYIPRSWTSDPDRCRAAGLGPDTVFATKPDLARTMIERFLDAGHRVGWVTGDEVYGGNPKLPASATSSRWPARPKCSPPQASSVPARPGSGPPARLVGLEPPPPGTITHQSLQTASHSPDIRGITYFPTPCRRKTPRNPTSQLQTHSRAVL